MVADGDTAMGLSNQTSFLRPVTEGAIHAEARARHRGRTTWVWEVECTDDADRPVRLSRITVAVRAVGSAALSQVRARRSLAGAPRPSQYSQRSSRSCGIADRADAASSAGPGEPEERRRAPGWWARMTAWPAAASAGVNGEPTLLASAVRPGGGERVPYMITTLPASSAWSSWSTFSVASSRVTGSGTWAPLVGGWES